MSNKKKKYTHPALIKPWEPVFPDLIVTSEAAADAINLKNMIEKIIALFEHYNISPTASNAYETLCMALAEDHVPGFQIKGCVGKPPTWRAAAGLELFQEVQSLKVKKGSDRAACGYLAKSKYNCPPDSLYTRYKEIISTHPASPLMQALLKK